LPSGKRPPADTARQIRRPETKSASEPEAISASAPVVQTVSGAAAASPAPVAAPPAAPAPAPAPALSPPVNGEAATDFNQTDSQRQ
jgi:hypothetical protein